LNEQEDESLGHNERLEFLGDAVLDYIVARLLFLRYPEMPEGDLTRLRSALVRTQTLAEIARKLDLGAYLRMSKGEDMSGGRARRALLCDAFEALLGALYLDQGVEAVSEFVTPLLLPLMHHILAEGLHIDARSKLQEWSQSAQGETEYCHQKLTDGAADELIHCIQISHEM
jgi:ribonuclease-3